MKLDDIAIASILAIGGWMAYKQFTKPKAATKVQQVVQGAITGGASSIQCIKAPCGPFVDSLPVAPQGQIEVHVFNGCPSGYVNAGIGNSKSTIFCKPRTGVLECMSQAEADKLARMGIAYTMPVCK